MNLNEFRNETRTWIQNNLPKEISGRPDGFSGGNKGGTQSSDHKRWFDACYERGFTVPSWPKEYGGAGLDQISYGLIMQELEKGDSSIRSIASVQSSLVIYPIWKYGTEEQKQKFLSKLVTGEYIGCFGLTEPDHGSNPAGMRTRIEDMGGYYLLNGSKMWITNAPIADIAVIWAKNEKDIIKGLIVEKNMEGFSTSETNFSAIGSGGLTLARDRLSLFKRGFIHWATFVGTRLV